MHRLSAPRPRRGRLLLLVTAALVLGAAVAAVPAAAAAAAPTPTKLRVTAQRSIVDWGGKAVLNGALLTDAEPPVAVDREVVLVQYSAGPTGPWTDAGTITNDAQLYTSGAYTYQWTASGSYYWFLSFAGVPGVYGAAPGNVVSVKVRPLLGKPVCPRSIKAGKKFTVSGSLKPRFPKGSKTVTVKVQRYTNGKWKPYKSYKATNADSGAYSKYLVRIKITRKGKYRFYAATATTEAFAAARSLSSRSLRIR